MDDVWPAAPGSIHDNRAGGEVASGPKKAVVEAAAAPRRRVITKKLVETVLLSVLVFIAAMLPMILTYVPPPESVLRMKEFMTEWCTPSICFVFLVVGIMVATSGVLNGAQSRGLHERQDYQRHVTVVQRDALRMPDIFSVGESVRPLSIPAPAPVPFPVRDFPAVRPLPVYLKRDLSSRFENDLRGGGLGKNSSSTAAPPPPPPRFEDLGPPAKVPPPPAVTPNLDRDSYFLRQQQRDNNLVGMSNNNSNSSFQEHPAMSSNGMSFQEHPVMSHSNSFRERLAARRAPISPVFEDDYIISPAPSSSSTVMGSAAAVQLEVPASPSPVPISAHPFEVSSSTVATTSSHQVIDHELHPPASPTMPHNDVVIASSSLSPTTLAPILTTACPPIPSTQPSPPAPHTPPPASPLAVRNSVLTPSPLALTSPPDSPVDDESAGSPVPESPVDSPPATPTASSPPPPPPDSPLATPMASPPPPPPLPPQSPQDSSLDATVITPVEVNLSPIVTRKVQRSLSSNMGSSSRSSKESSGRKPPSHPTSRNSGEPMSMPAKGSTSAAQKHEGESYFSMKDAGAQSQKHDLPPDVEVSNERPSAASSQNVAGSAVEDTNLKPADDDVDQRVEAFLANFRQQMRMQRQESLLRHQRGEE
ncbi:hypothetical protein CY35_03G130000 [Sphagnum magellanicum]|nr:hypothetical protein CY35_03G130000 [Sphagnum magellanicum]